MKTTPLEILINGTKDRWLYKNSKFIYPFDFMLDDNFALRWVNDTEYNFKYLEVEKENHEVEIKVGRIIYLFDAIFIEAENFKFLKSIEAKHKLLE